MIPKLKTIISLLFLIGVVLVAGFIVYKNKPSDQSKISHEFDGSAKSLKENTLIASGNYLSIDNKTRSTTVEDIQIYITSETKFTKTTFTIPSAEELKKTNGIFEPEKLPRTTVASSINELRSGIDTGLPIGIKIKSANNKNILGLKVFEAAEINYIIPNTP